MRKLTKSECGKLGGLAVVSKYGTEHMKKLNALFHKKYQYVPYGENDFALQNRLTGELNKKTLNGNRVAK